MHHLPNPCNIVARRHPLADGESLAFATILFGSSGVEYDSNVVRPVQALITNCDSFMWTNEDYLIPQVAKLSRSNHNSFGLKAFCECFIVTEKSFYNIMRYHNRRTPSCQKRTPRPNSYYYAETLKRVPVLRMSHNPLTQCLQNADPVLYTPHPNPTHPTLTSDSSS